MFVLDQRRRVVCAYGIYRLVMVLLEHEAIASYIYFGGRLRSLVQFSRSRQNRSELLYTLLKARLVRYGFPKAWWLVRSFNKYVSLPKLDSAADLSRF